MKRIDERELREELVKLRAEHRELDDQIILLEDQASADQLLVKCPSKYQAEAEKAGHAT